VSRLYSAKRWNREIVWIRRCIRLQLAEAGALRDAAEAAGVPWMLAGTLRAETLPAGVRVDSAVEEGGAVTPTGPADDGVPALQVIEVSCRFGGIR